MPPNLFTTLLILIFILNINLYGLEMRSPVAIVMSFFRTADPNPQSTCVFYCYDVPKRYLLIAFS